MDSKDELYLLQKEYQRVEKYKKTKIEEIKDKKREMKIGFCFWTVLTLITLFMHIYPIALISSGLLMGTLCWDYIKLKQDKKELLGFRYATLGLKKKMRKCETNLQLEEKKNKVVRFIKEEARIREIMELYYTYGYYLDTPLNKETLEDAFPSLEKEEIEDCLKLVRIKK